jgi:ABC-2 type transport system ATP-binding protein
LTNAIEAHDLKKTFGGEVRALDGVSFAVEEGTIFGLLGPNGAGKTTAVRILTTILGPDSGTGLVLGYDVVAQADRVRTLIGLAGQYAAVDENLTGRENLTMVGRLNHMERDAVVRRAVELLDEFGLTDAGDRPLKTYSGGMRRRLDVAAALVARPKVLFLDEPTTGLDPQSRADVWAMIEHLVAEGTSVLLTTQYLEEADILAHQIAVVDHGRVIAEGTPTQLKANLGATVLDVGLADAELARQAAAILDTIGAKSPTVIGTVVELPVDDGPRVAMEVLRLLDQHTLVPTTFRIREPSLDDVFLALTGKRAEGDDDPGNTPTDGQRSGKRRARAAAAAGTTNDGGAR